MSAERTAEEWGRVAGSLPGWRWMPGMAWSEPEHGLSGRMHDAEEAAHHNRFTGHTETIDPDDPATGGCLLALLGSVDKIDRIADALQLPKDVCAADAVMDAVMSGDMGRVSRACIAAAEAVGRWPA